MMKVYDSIVGKVGKTSLVGLRKIEEKFKLSSSLYAKIEGSNPSGSVKDRAALFMIKYGEREGRLKQGTVIVEATSGNLGISLSMISSFLGYRSVVVMPSSVSKERIALVQAYGGEVVLSDGGMDEARRVMDKIVSGMKNAFTPSQFTNKNNIIAHYLTTGPEIYNQTSGEVDILVCGVGSGGTICGVGRFLKEKRKSVKIVAVEPRESPLLSGGMVGKHRIQGIGADFIPPLFDRSLVDEIIKVGDDEAEEYALILARTEGILAGISSGAALFGGVLLAGREENKGKRIVVILPDRGERYISTGLFDKV